MLRELESINSLNDLICLGMLLAVRERIESTDPRLLNSINKVLATVNLLDLVLCKSSKFNAIKELCYVQLKAFILASHLKFLESNPWLKGVLNMNNDQKKTELVEDEVKPRVHALVSEYLLSKTGTTTTVEELSKALNERNDPLASTVFDLLDTLGRKEYFQGHHTRSLMIPLSIAVADITLKLEEGRCSDLEKRFYELMIKYQLVSDPEEAAKLLQGSSTSQVSLSSSVSKANYQP